MQTQKSTTVDLVAGGLATLLLFGGAGAAAAGDAEFRAAEGLLEIVTPRWNVAFDEKTGVLRRLADRAGSGSLLKSGSDLWIIERHDAEAVRSSGCGLQHQWNAEREELTLRFDGPEASVEIVCAALNEGPAWRTTVRMQRGTMLGWRFPNELEFDPQLLNEFIFPEHLGLAFTRHFFAPGGAGHARHSLAGRGLQQVADDRCQMRPLDDPPVEVRPGKAAADWLPEWYFKEIPRWRVTANRVPAGNQHELSLLETEHGCWLAGYQLGGWGWLFRLGGRLGDNDARPRLASVIATLAHVRRTPPSGGRQVAVPVDLAGKVPAAWPEPPSRIGLVIAPPTGRPGVRYDDPTSRLVAELQRQDWFRQGNMSVEMIQTPETLSAALAEPRDWFALINTIPEGFPAAAAAEAENMLAAIREYVRAGGVWWEAGGGYPFHAAVIPADEMVFRSANRAFCDFGALDSQAGRWSLFGIQPPESIYVPALAELRASGAAEQRTGYYSHVFQAFARQGATRSLPLQQMVIGRPHRQALADYGRRNGFQRGLHDKASAAVVEKLKSSILLKVSTRRLTETTAIAEKLPYPVLFHIVDYLHGGFDKQYPDHLPPRPEVGSPADLAALVEACRRRGHLLMPYTNPTWWCTNPQGPTFEREGEAPLARDLAGNIYPERYGESYTQGYTITAWHPAVQKANAVIRRQFTEEYPVDVLFQDQVGARGHKWDTNPASPDPGAYLEGIHRIAQTDAAVVPVGTEDGSDRLINWETMFCGLSFPWLPNKPAKSRILYEDLWRDEAWRIEPLALLLAHDKVLFYHHDLGGFVRNRLDLSVTLVMGYGLSWWTRTSEPSREERDWLDRLCRVQAAVGPRCAGRSLDEFEYLAKRVIRSRWGGLEIIANLAAAPWETDSATAIAPEGFLARSPDLEAGIFVRRAGQQLAPEGHWLIRTRAANAWSEWSASADRRP